ncbi:restriction endonuclease subunit S [Mannheimia haemolytica]|uniref:restriction endonuclease subunit S n=1 Tax=Mannheimia haemolytica TaxID=75985 RepID=UPI0002C4EDC5|nr:restriction endonuclease subunit S [Mannheimia haemolytica]AGI31684.1 restriction endonuclease subunit S [Mannheimia haemolytica USDA-ARS-USMARC-183]AKA10531.1 restriction endonuclease subunit S [Mannheimia haemolytica]ASW35440.1 restriction endonuclease subunit S [Mannheimia haemolytica]OHY17049.1 restriction endonuclease subunit S [Mannheimia haemolytica]QEA74384.1 restriction endonuclease subunit S [Mannheimia haemolytica]
MWVRLGDICLKITDGTHHSPPNIDKSDFLYITAKNIKKDGLDLSKISYVTKEIHNEIFSRCNPEKGDILYIKDGATTGVSIINTLNEPFSMLSSVALIKTSQEIDNEYLNYVMNSHYFYNISIGSMSGTGIPRITLTKLESYLVPVPPLLEQQRIVQKIEELLPLVERYEQTEQQLTKLNNTFPEQLKKSVLHAAIQGKLTEQDPNDELASCLIERIKAEKNRLIAEKKLKKPKSVSEIVMRDNLPYEIKAGQERCIADEVPFEIPQNWIWVRLENYSLNHDRRRKPVSVAQRSQQNKLYDYYGATGAIDKVASYIFDGKFILIGEDGGNFFTKKDVAFIVEGKFWANNHVHVLSVDFNLEKYFCYYLNALNLPSMGLINGIAVPKLNQRNLNSILIAIPPISEQHRIVEKIEKLFSEIEKF